MFPNPIKPTRIVSPLFFQAEHDIARAGIITASLLLLSIFPLRAISFFTP
jgi:hypothetical protein